MVQLYKRRADGELLVNTTTLNTQSGGSIAMLPGGGFIVTWSDNSLTGGDASGFGIVGQLFDANGGKVGGEFLVNTTTTGNQSVSNVATLPSGRFVVTWIDGSATGGDTSSNAVRAQIFEANGTRVGTEFLVNTETANSQSSPAVTELAGGGFVIAWSDSSGIGGDASGSAVKAQVFSAAGVPVGGEFLVNATTFLSQGSSGINLVAMASGGFAVAYGTVGSNQGLIGCSVYVQLFDAGGTKVGGELLVNEDPYGNLNSVNVSALNGGFIVTWSQQDSSQDPSIPVTYDLHAQMFDANGAKVGPDFVVNTTTAGSQTTNDVDRLPGGGFLVTWVGTGANGVDTDIFGQFFDDDGNALGAEFLINTVTTANQTGVRVDVTETGDIVVIWTDGSGTGTDTSQTGIKMQVFVPTALAPTDIALSNDNISEVAVENVAVATLTAASSGLNPRLSYTIVSDSTGGAFRIEGDLLVVDNSALLDFETRPNVEIRIRATDLNGSSYEETLTLNIQDSATEDRYAAGDQFLVTTDAHDTSGGIAVVALASGGFAVLTSWFDFGGGSSSSDEGQRLQVFDAAGAPVGAAHELDLGLGNGAIAMAALSTGGVVLAYEGRSVSYPGGNYYPITAQLFDATGNAVGPEITVSGGTVSGYQPVITALADGNFVVAWGGPDESGVPGALGSQVLAQLFEADGDKIGGEFRLNTGVENGQYWAQVASAPGGGFFATWVEVEADRYRIEGQRFDAAGAKLGGELLLLDLPIVEDDPVGTYRLTALADGDMLLSWAAVVGEEPSVYEIRTRLVSPDGSLGDVQPLFASLEPYYEVAALPDGGFAVTLASPVEENGPDHVGAFLFDAAGQPIGTGFEVPESGTGEASDARIAVLASGEIVITFHGRATDGLSLSDVYGRILGISDSQAPSGPTPGPDVLTGTAEADRIDGLAGDDVILGLGGNDVLIGGLGADRTEGGSGDDAHFVDNALDVAVEL
ncbi:MAG TPA: cadherin domain-containing protein, partial [Allosphingosinicella sp.]|nr:cadherin domain-containing protein [Allosphingosinicella sp.]